MAERFWLMWGARDPFKKKPPQLVVKGQQVYSRTNYNLSLDRDLETGAIAEEYTLALLVRELAYPWAFFQEEPVSLRELGEEESRCDVCREDTGSPCMLFLQPQPRDWPQELSFPDAVRSLMQTAPLEGAATKWCDIFRHLARMTETAEERRFYELYLDWVLTRGRIKAHKDVKRAVADPRKAGLGADVGTKLWAERLGYNLLSNMSVPALLPQVVLNFVRAADLPEDHPDRHFFDSSAGRVDFVFVHKGERHIIEIDGPIHHATEKGYTRNLRVDRTLRNQGWHVHRFSNLEVKEAKDFWEFARELGIVPFGFMRTELS